MNLQKQQQGATLITALLILLVMTIIGVAGMDESIVEDKMVLNFNDRAMANNSAESAIRGGEAWLTDQVIKPEPTTSSDCANPPLCGAGQSDYVVWEPDDLVGPTDSWANKDWAWWQANTIEYHGSSGVNSQIGGAYNQPRSVIEFREFNAISDTGIASNLNAETTMQGVGWHYYNILGAGSGYRAETMAIVESTFKKWF